VTNEYRRFVQSGEQLCLACRLCCDGTLFGHVKLGLREDAKKLKALGLPIVLSRGQAPVARFRQPCTALCRDGKCGVYAERPQQCRAFECRVYQDLRDGKLEFDRAAAFVRRARRRAERVRKLLRQLGDADEHRSLSERFGRAQKRMETGAVQPAEAELFAELTQAMHALQLLAHEAFYTQG
jgi:uncharacterized protein